MRHRPAAGLSAVPALVLTVLLAGCSGGGDEPDGGSAVEPTTTESTGATETSPEPVDGPVAGSGAGLDAADAEAWCGAVAPDQLAAATGFEVSEVRADGDGVQTCTAELPGVELLVSWGTDTTGKSFEKYAASLGRPAGVREATETELDGGQPAVVATQATPPTAFAGTVTDGELVQVVVSGVAAPDADPAQLGEVASAILAVYFD